MSNTPNAKLHTLDTAALIEACNETISSYAGRFNLIVDLLSARADNNDAVAEEWFA